MEESPDRLQGSVHGFFLIEEVMLIRSAPRALGPLLLNNLAMFAIGYALQATHNEGEAVGHSLDTS